MTAWCRYSIHVADKDRETQQEAEASFPRSVDGLDNVFHCGFHSELSFGCASYLVTRPEGNVLVDVPRFVPKLLKRIQVCCTNTPHVFATRLFRSDNEPRVVVHCTVALPHQQQTC